MKYEPHFVKNVVPPEWIENLPPGTYELKELVAISGIKPPSIMKRLKKYGCTVRTEHACNNIYKNIVIWEGFKPVSVTESNK